MAKYNIHFLGNCTIEADSEDEAFDKFQSTRLKPSEAAEEYSYDVGDVSESDFEPCDFCDAPQWFGIDEHGNSEACKHCAYASMIDEHKE